MRTRTTTALLLLAVAVARADDVDPEPPGAGVRQLLGKWQCTKQLSNGVEGSFRTTSYDFKKGKVTCSYGGKGQLSETLTYKIEAQRQVILMTYNGATRTYFFKIEKGELYLSPDRSNNPKAKADFSGKTATVMILKKVK